MVERESKVKTKANTKKKLLIAAGVVVVALAAALVFISNYLVNYAIGRSGNGGDREVALEVDAPADSVEAVMEDNRAAYKSKIDTFTKEHPGRDVTLTADDGLTLHGVYYANAETADTHRWALVLHGYRGDYTGALQLAAPYYEAGYQVIAPDLRACGESEGDYVGMAGSQGHTALDRFHPCGRPAGENCYPRHLNGSGYNDDDGRGEHTRQCESLRGGLRLHQCVGYFFQ